MALQQLRTADIDDLVTLRLNGTPVAQRDKRGRRAAEVLALLRQHSNGAQYAEIFAALGNPGIKALDRLVASGEVLRPDRGRYVAARASDPDRPKVPGSVSARTVVTMLVVLSSALDDAMREGLVARNVARLVKRPGVEHHEMASWTPEQAGQFREHVRDERLVACGLLTLAGLRRSELLGLRWSDVDLDAGTVSVAQGRVVVAGQGTVTGDPKSKRSRRALPMPADVLTALRAFKVQQASERLALGERYPDTGLVAVNEDGSPSGRRPTRPNSPGWRKPLACPRFGCTMSGTPPPPCSSTAAPHRRRRPSGWVTTRPSRYGCTGTSTTTRWRQRATRYSAGRGPTEIGDLTAGAPAPEETATRSELAALLSHRTDISPHCGLRERVRQHLGRIGPLIEERMWPNPRYSWLSGVLEHRTNRVAPPSDLAYFIDYNPNPNAAIPAP
jgi:integrase